MQRINADSIPKEDLLNRKVFVQEISKGLKLSFGGSIVFIPKKKPHSAYYLTCVCPNTVEKRGNEYYITETLAHMSGSGRVIKIYSGGNRTYLGEISDDKIEVLDTLMEKGSWTNSDTPSEIVDNIYHYRFLGEHGTVTKHMYSSGDIYVKQDTIVIGYVYKEWPRKEGN